ncbi:MAG: diaminopimelate decarboxylase [Desulfocapsaceae bacterium]|jgi:diaminopimelate decarboxylase|nr:diaminopimelate decarboxylase [Desulfocapsaceae bacterium]
MSEEFKTKLFPLLPELSSYFGTPFHIYDEAGIKTTSRNLLKCFSGVDDFREYYAVKALPNPVILAIMKEVGFGFDCSSIPELILSRQAGGRGDDLMFTSNNTSREEFEAAAADGGSILNLDDISLVAKVPKMPEKISFRYNPGAERDGNTIIGSPLEAKYGVSREQIVDAYRLARDRGAKQFGIHTMLASNELKYEYMVTTARMLLELVEKIQEELGITFEFINIGGGLGIPYRPEEAPLNLETMGVQISELFRQFKAKHKYMPALYMESGRYITGPHGALVVSAINRKEIYRTYIGVDACMSALMRPALYDAYHHIDVVSAGSSDRTEVVDVVGSLCENNDKFAVQRELPVIGDGDLLVIHDTGAHGHAMGFNYNSKLRPQELLFRENGVVELIRRAETTSDYFATLDFPDKVYRR